MLSQSDYHNADWCLVVPKRRLRSWYLEPRVVFHAEAKAAEQIIILELSTRLRIPLFSALSNHQNETN